MNAVAQQSLTLRTVPAREGWGWIRKGFSLLIANPAPIHLGLMFLFACLLISSAVPMLGMVLPALLMPALYLGLMNVIAATNTAATEQAPQATRQQKLRAFTAMLTVFQDWVRLRRLMLLGAMYGLAMIAMLGLAALFDDGFVFKHLVLGDAIPNTNEAKQQLLNAIWVVLPLYTPVSLIFWFAPQLVGGHGHGIAKALFFSGLGCWRNLGAFGVYAAAWVLIFVGVNLLLALVISMIGTAVGTALAMIVSVFLVTWLYCSFYASYVSLVQVVEVGETESSQTSH